MQKYLLEVWSGRRQVWSGSKHLNVVRGLIGFLINVFYSQRFRRLVSKHQLKSDGRSQFVCPDQGKFQLDKPFRAILGQCHQLFPPHPSIDHLPLARPL